MSTLELDRLPAMAPLLARGLFLGLTRKQGTPPQALAEFPRLAVHVSGVRADPVRLARYRAVCQSPERGCGLPPAFLETLFIGPMARLVTDARFPLSPLGLIHVRQTIDRREPLSADAVLDLECRVAECRATERGLEVDFAMEALCGGVLAWHGCATVLSRDVVARERGPRPARSEPASEGGDPAALEVVVPERTGRRYAAASGDWNPHHLWSFTARPLGYRRPIAHGMWTLARVLAELEAGDTAGLPLQADVVFRKPILLPGAIRIVARPEGDRGEGRIALEVREARGASLHLAGHAITARS